MTTIKGTAGNDTSTGTAASDVFDMSQGGNDTVSGLAGNDQFSFGAAFTAADSIDGGAGTDTLLLNGDYSAGVIMGAATLVNVERIALSAGHDYNFTTGDATVAAGAELRVDAGALGASNHLTFDGSAETNGRFSITGGLGNDLLTGGAGNDVFNLSKGGHDTAIGGGGTDRFTFAGNLDSADRINGGAGDDVVAVQGDYTVGTTLNGTMLNSVERFVVGPGHNDSFTVDDTLIAAGKTFEVNASALSAASRLFFNGTGETDGHFHIIGGAAGDILMGGGAGDIFDLGHGGNDTVTGGGGADRIIAGPGHDTFTYLGVSDSSSTVHDTIVGFDASLDKFDLDVSVTGYDGQVSGAISGRTFDADLANAIGNSLGAHHAIVVNATAGGLEGHTYLIVDANGSAAYNAGADYVIDITGAANLASLGTANFI